ncbi:MAG: hypothetical protein QXP70_06360 [Methanomassiliicoccales archaeon]
MKDDVDSEEPEEKDGLDEWVDELDRLIGVETYTEEELKSGQTEKTAQKNKRDPLIYVAIVIVVLIVIALLLLFHVI